MTQCRDVQPLFAAYLDDPAAGDHDVVERHRRVCQACDAQLRAEAAARDAVRRNAPALRSETAPFVLTTRLAAIARETRPAIAWRPLLLRGAAATMLALAVGVWWLGMATRASAVVLAAQLTADHKKCFFTARDVGALQARKVAAYLSDRYGFDVRVPDNSAALGLRLVGARRCPSGEGTNAHLLYTWQGESVSLYLLPSDRRTRSSLELLGHDTEVWTGHNGSYVLVTRATNRDRTELVNYMQHATQ